MKNIIYNLFSISLLLLGVFIIAIIFGAITLESIIYSLTKNHQRYADFCFYEGDYWQAKEKYSLAIEQDSTNAELFYKRALTNYELALMTYELNHYHDELDALLQSWNDAMMVLNLNDSNPPLGLFRLMTNIQYRLGNTEKIIDFYSDKSNKNGYNFLRTGDIKLALNSFILYDYKEGLLDVINYIDKNFNYLILITEYTVNELYYFKGIAYYYLRDYRNSLLNFSISLSFDNNYTIAYIARGHSSRMLQNHYSDIKNFNMAIENLNEQIEYEQIKRYELIKLLSEAYLYKSLSYAEIGDLDSVFINLEASCELGNPIEIQKLETLRDFYSGRYGWVKKIFTQLRIIKMYPE